MIQDAIAGLVRYGLTTGLIEKEDAVYTANRVLALLKIDSLDEKAEDAFTGSQAEKISGTRDENIIGELSEILGRICDYAYEHQLMGDNTVTCRDLFDTEIMAILTDRPSSVTAKFRAEYSEDPVRATDSYYRFCQDTNYIRRDRIAKDVRWTADTEYGTIDISINLSKPEKDPKAIAAARNAAQTAYPKCQLCRENEGYAGRLDHPARGNHRIIPITVDGEPWFFQYSPYVYYNEHCIVFNSVHKPMIIDRGAFRKLLKITEIFPHYFVGSNADLPIVGGSILAHEHFQGGHYTFAMAKAPVEEEIVFRGYEDVRAGIVKWPLSVIRLNGTDPERVADLAAAILKTWRGYTDEDAFIYAQTDGEPHNTITPIARRRDGSFELDLALRNNITTREHPLGVYHPHAQYFHIKKENIGLIEVMGLAILPARLKTEMAGVKDAILTGKDLRADEALAKHADWVDEFSKKYTDINSANADAILRDEIGLVFSKVLECAGVYKRMADGKAAFERFIDAVQKEL